MEIKMNTKFISKFVPHKREVKPFLIIFNEHRNGIKNRWELPSQMGKVFSQSLIECLKLTIHICRGEWVRIIYQLLTKGSIVEDFVCSWIFGLPPSWGRLILFVWCCFSCTSLPTCWSMVDLSMAVAWTKSHGFLEHVGNLLLNPVHGGNENNTRQTTNTRDRVILVKNKMTISSTFFMIFENQGCASFSSPFFSNSVESVDNEICEQDKIYERELGLVPILFSNKVALIYIYIYIVFF